MVIRITKPPPRATVEAWLRKALTQAADAALLTIRKRTESGRDINGATFAPYTPDYAKAKAEAGRNTAVPDLTLSSQMLRNMKRIRVERGRVIHGFDGQHSGIRISSLRRTRKGAVTKTRRRAVVREIKANEAGFFGGTSVPMASVALGVSQKRPFFGVRRKDEKDKITAVAQRVLDGEIAKWNASVKST